MKRNLAIVCVLAWAIAWGMPATGKAFDWGLLWHWQGCWPDCVRSTCCDDYAPKCPPCLEPQVCLSCDDYVPKCPPRARPVCRFECDDYRPKCEPRVNCPPRARR